MTHAGKAFVDLLPLLGLVTHKMELQSVKEINKSIGERLRL